MAEFSECSGILEIYRAAQAYGDVEETTSSVAPSNELQPRSLEETHMVILDRDPASRASNARYRCKYCSKEFMGGPQKIRVHLSGRRENATRLAKCPSVPEDVKEMMIIRMKPKRNYDAKKSSADDTQDDSNDESSRETSLGSSTQPRSTQSLPIPPPLSLPSGDTADGLERRSREEDHMIVLSRRYNASPTFISPPIVPISSISSSPPSTPANSPRNKRRSYNSQYQCKYCHLVFVGGPQKIRVHISGIPEGSTRVVRCEYAPAEAKDSILAIRREMATSDSRGGMKKKRKERTSDGEDEEGDDGSNKDMNTSQEKSIDTAELKANLEILGLL
eukprot:gene24242-29314_t